MAKPRPTEKEQDKGRGKTTAYGEKRGKGRGKTTGESRGETTAYGEMRRR